MNITALALTCRLEDRETPTSFAARLAIRNFSGRAEEFCKDVGIIWKGLIRGDEGDIERLAQISGADGPALQRYAFRAPERRRLRIGREAANIGSVRRMTPKACPRCLRNSVGELGFAGAFRRADWQFISVRACERHSVPLIHLPYEAIGNHIYDFAALVREHRHVVEAAAADAPRRHPTDLEHYIRKRLSGWQGKSWIDSWPLSVVCKASEMLGARLEFGPDLLQAGKLGDEDLHLAGGKGFDVLRSGPDRLRRVLLDFKEEHISYQACHGRDMGLFFSWLTNCRKMRGIKPLRDLVRDHIVEHYPVERGTIILGRRIDDPKCFTLLNVKRTFGFRRERLNHFIAEMADTPAASSTSLRAHEVEGLRKKIEDVVPLYGAAEILGCRIEQIARFVRAGMLVRRGNGSVRPYLSQAEVEAFVAPVLSLEPACPDGRLMSLSQMTHIVSARVHEIYQCFLDNDLKSARRDPTKTGLGALLLDPMEVKDHLPVSQAADPTLFDVAKRLKSTTRTLRYLATQGELRIYRTRHPITRKLQDFVDSTTLERFRKNFIIIGELITTFGLPAGPLANLLSSKGLRSRKVPARISPIYRRADVERILDLHEI